MRRLLLALPLFVLLGCALSPGAPFGVLEGALSSHYPQEGDGWRLTPLGYEVRVATLQLGFEGLALWGVTPAAPEAVAQLAVAQLPPLSLVPGERGGFSCGGQPCELPRSEVTRAVLAVSSLAVTGEVRDAHVPPRFGDARRFEYQAATSALAFEAEVPAGTVAFTGRNPSATLNLTLVPPAGLFAEIDWAPLAGTGVIDLGAAENAVAANALRSQLATTTLEVTEGEAP